MAWKKDERRYLSWSQISSYRKCGLIYYHSYELGIKIPPPWTWPWGRSVEGGLNYNFNQKIRTRKDLALKEVLEAYAFSFEGEFQKDEVDWQGENKGKVKDRGVKLVGKYHQERSPLIQPIAVQDRIRVPFNNVSYDFLGILDLVEEKDEIVDFKASQKTPNQSLAITSEQLTGYSLCYRVKYGKPEKKVKLEYLVSLKEEERLVPLEAIRTSQEIDAFLKMVARVYEGIEKQIFVPCQEEISWWCGIKQCGYYSRCKPRRTVMAMAKLEKEAEEKRKAEKKAKKKQKVEEVKNNGKSASPKS